jgi:hypothetical protein
MLQELQYEYWSNGYQMCLALEKVWVQFSAVPCVIFSGTSFGPLKRKEINDNNASNRSYKMMFLYVMEPEIP